MDSKMILSARETALYLGIGMNKTYELLASGQIPTRRIGRKYLIPRLALDRWLTAASSNKEIAHERLHK